MALSAADVVARPGSWNQTPGSRLRHSAASMMIAEGVHPKAIQTQLGHSSIAVTMDRYGHLLPSDRDAMAVRLNARFRASQELSSAA